MTSKSFVKYMASENGLTQVATREFLAALDKSIKSYVSQMESGDSVKVADIILKVKDAPERSGVCALNGEPWTKPAHKSLKVSVTKSMRDVDNITIDATSEEE